MPIRSLLGTLFLCLVLGATGTGADAPGSVPLNAANTSLLKRLENYLDTVRTVRSRFLQVSSAGDVAEGLFEMSRPGKMRIEYDPPVPVEIVADGDWIHYHDRELKQVTSSPIRWTPAAPLLNEDIKLLNGRYIVTGLDQAKNAFIVTLTDRERLKDIGSLTLVFTDNPLALRKWSVTDARGIVTSVTLISPDFSVSFDKGFFSFENPYPDILSDENR